MIAAVLLLALAQAPCLGQEMSLVCFCKAGRLSACEALRQTEPVLADRLQKAAVQLMEEQRERARQEEAAEAAGAQASSASPEPPDCRGQEHHIISRPIAKKLEDHLTLRGLYKPRDPRFVARAKDQAAHCGYQEWHREVDREVIRWLEDHPKATPQQFEEMLRAIYSRPAMSKRFPNGF